MKQIDAFRLQEGQAFFFPKGRQRCRVISINEGIGVVEIVGRYSYGSGEKIRFRRTTRYLSPNDKVRVYD